MCKFRSYWEYWPHLHDYSGAAWTWSHTPQEWLLYSVCQIVQCDYLSSSCTPCFWHCNLIYCLVGIYIHMSIYKPYEIDSIWCSILQHKMCLSDNCSDRYNMHMISLFANLDEPVNTFSPTMRIFVLHWNHRHTFLSLRTYYPLLSLLPPLWNGRDHFSARQALLKWEDLILWSPAKV